MPSESPAQKHLMDAVAHGWHKPGGGGPSVAVAKEFVAADKAHPAFANGGLVVSNKGYQGKDTEGAKGGAKLGRARDFMKESDGDDQRGFGKIPDAGYKNTTLDDQDYEKTGKTGKLSKPTGDKCLPTAKPRS